MHDLLLFYKISVLRFFRQKLRPLILRVHVCTYNAEMVAYNKRKLNFIVLPQRVHYLLMHILS